MNDPDEIRGLQAEVKRLLAAAIAAEERHVVELERRDVANLVAIRQRDEAHLAESGRRDHLHVAETQRRDELHLGESQRRGELHTEELERLRRALDARDVIGQAKGLIMATMGCSADDAFAALTKQSQYENRDVHEIAVSLVSQAVRASRTPGSIDRS